VHLVGHKQAEPADLVARAAPARPVDLLQVGPGRPAHLPRAGLEQRGRATLQEQAGRAQPGPLERRGQRAMLARVELLGTPGHARLEETWEHQEHRPTLELQTACRCQTGLRRMVG